MNKKLIFVFIIGLGLLIGVVIFILPSRDKADSFQKSTQNPAGTRLTQTTQALPGNDKIILEGYPIDIVPLFEVKDIEAMKYFVNEDPVNFEGYFGKRKQFYNVIFSTSAKKTDVFSYYRGLLTEENPENTNPNKIEGRVGELKISVSQYSDDRVHLEVHDGATRQQEDNPYYGNYPEIVMIDSSWIMYESSYGKLKQNDGTEEYTQYFVIDTEKLDEESKQNPMRSMYEKYVSIYSEKPMYQSDPETGIISYTDGEYRVTMSFAEDHGRIYLMIRKPLAG